MKNDKLLALIPVPLLDGKSTHNIFKAINSPIHFPKPSQELGAVAKHKLESEYIASNLVSTKFMFLAADEAEKCKTCSSRSPIYTHGDHQLCILELFKGNKGEMNKPAR